MARRRANASPGLTKKNRVKQRNQVDLDRELEKNLRAYETAGRTEKANLSLRASVWIVAVSLCARALSQRMLGEVVCTPANESLHGPGQLQFDLNNDGINDVGMSVHSTFVLGSGGNFFRLSSFNAYGLVAGNGTAANHTTMHLPDGVGRNWGRMSMFPEARSWQITFLTSLATIPTGTGRT